MDGDDAWGESGRLFRAIEFRDIQIIKILLDLLCKTFSNYSIDGKDS